MSRICENLQRKREAKADNKLAIQQFNSSLAAPSNTYQESPPRLQLSDYLKQQKNLRTKDKILNVRVWKRKNLEYKQRALPVDDPALDGPNSNNSCDTKELQRLQTIEKDYLEQEKMMQLAAKQQDLKKAREQQDTNYLSN